MRPQENALFTVRIFPEDETTEIVYENVSHVFWEAEGTVLVLCLPDRHAHWLREWIRHYDIWKEGSSTGGGYFGRHPDRDAFTTWIKCKLCDGTGCPGPYRDDAKCPQCGGTGRIRVHVPAC